MAGLLTICLGMIACGETGFADDDGFFEKQVRPLLVKRCYACHSGAKMGGGLSLETKAGWSKGGENGPTIVPGKPEESLLVDAVNYRSLEMPPRDKGGPLSAEEIAVLTKWIASGAHDPRVGSETLGGMSREQARTWWAFQPLPLLESELTPEDVDRFIQAGLDRHSLTPAGPADKRTQMRRVTYDLTGLPPTPAEVDAFLADDSADAFDKVVDRLLDSPQYGVHWGRHWLDVVRYADTAGENTDRPLPHAWRYRNWVFESFNRDLPYDEFVRKQMAGDIVSPDAPDRAEGIIATGYLAVARRFGHDIDKDAHLMYEDVIDNLGKNFLGLSLGCARCHDHKYDPVTSADYYALYGIFNSTKFSFPGCEAKGQPRDMMPLIGKEKLDRVTADYRKRLEEYEQRENAAAAETQRLKQVAAGSTRVLAESAVGEGQTVSLHKNRGGALDRVVLRKGEVLQLVVLPNASHGADTTRVELEITQIRLDAARWSVANLIPTLTAGGPMITQGNASWCCLDVTDGPLFLNEKKVNIDGQSSLSAWTIGGTPSVLVNASADPVPVWTTLPGRSFFVHPGVNRNVAVAWVCPQDGEYRVRGLVSDAHPSQGDGVAFRLEHVASADYGTGLIELGKSASVPKKPRPEPPAIPVAYAVTESEPANVRMHERGDPEQLGDEIPRRWLSVFGGETVSAEDGSGRKQLGGWIADNPLTARVMVNRVWHWHFGRGFVATPNDFGARGDAPSYPELLNALVAQFRAEGYRLKPLHRLIVRTAAYRRSSAASADTAEADPDNRWLARFSRRRLTAEEIRDSLLTASGQLDLSAGEAHPFPPESSWKFTQHNPFNAVYETNRRSAYLMVQRQRRHPYLALFDGADPNSSTAVRDETTVPTQALYFLNDPFFHRQAAAFAESLDEMKDNDVRIREVFRRLFQRPPTTEESDLARRFLSKYPGNHSEKWAAYARVLMASNEFLFVD